MTRVITYGLDKLGLIVYSLINVKLQLVKYLNGEKYDRQYQSRYKLQHRKQPTRAYGP